ncbi:MAG: cold shock domain-containing protein [Candidatus Competibacteraceae bacterium]
MDDNDYDYGYSNESDLESDLEAEYRAETATWKRIEAFRAARSKAKIIGAIKGFVVGSFLFLVLFNFSIWMMIIGGFIGGFIGKIISDSPQGHAQKKQEKKDKIECEKQEKKEKKDKIEREKQEKLRKIEREKQEKIDKIEREKQEKLRKIEREKQEEIQRLINIEREKEYQMRLQVTGVIKIFNKAKLYGFIVPYQGSDLFFHFSDVLNVNDSDKLLKNDRVEFKIVTNSKGNKAIKIKKLNVESG